ncbi:hypothetical protein K7472_16460 [Streptomyces sp. PTM05]|uniref:GH26 domain-containing protein n=1 Tax=Streptantibioticus parmotrematis TaxID=2873249 RepID=A0ABS7QTC7_9ACTN|nr:glycosyl hydrolase [Streptantibioticus parmotrematis]MBY8886448.1 hypothetical protein [Streptantibioticus parmotrematis]
MRRTSRGKGSRRRAKRTGTIAGLAALLGAAAFAASTFLTTPGAQAAAVTHPVIWGLESGSISADVGGNGIVGGSATADTMSGKASGLAPGIDSWFVSQAATAANVNQMNVSRAAGAVPMIAWSPQGTLSQIASGAQDAQLTSMAQSLAAYGHPFYIRPFAEFNTPWETYSLGKSGNTPQAMSAAWKRMFGIFRKYDGSNALFVWTVGYSGTTNTVKPSWPGSGYVNYVGIDAYDWCTSASWCPGDQYRYKSMLALLRSFDAGRPTMLAETATGLNTAGKGAWLSNALSASKADGLYAVIWFDEALQGQPDWRLAVPPAAAPSEHSALLQTMVASPRWDSITTLEKYAVSARWN